MSKILVVEKYTLVQDGGNSDKVFAVEFSDMSTAFGIGSVTEFEGFLGKEVEVSFRDDIFEGRMQSFINYIVVRSVVATLDKEENIKLYTDEMPETGSNVDFRDFAVADFVVNCTVFCDSVQLGSSAKATWVDLNILDRKRNSTKLKVFNPENVDVNIFAGKYLMCDLRRTKYGFSTQEVRIREDITILANPEFELARKFIIQEFQDDLEFLNELLRIGFIDAAMSYNDPEIGSETGHVLMETAVAVSVASAMKNTTNKVDIKLLRRALVCQHLYVMSDSQTQVLSKEIQTVIKLASLPFKNKRLMAMLEKETRKPLIEKMLMKSINDISVVIANTTRTMSEALSSSKVWR